MDGVKPHFHSDRCYQTGAGDTEVLVCGLDAGPVMERDDDIPVETRRELMHCAVQNGRIRYGYLLDIFRRGRRSAIAEPPTGERLSDVTACQAPEFCPAYPPSHRCRGCLLSAAYLEIDKLIKERHTHEV